jgi:integrase
LQSWESCLKEWLYKTPWADWLVSDIGDAQLKSFVDTMFAAGRSAQTIRTYTTLAKMIIGSAKDARGQLIPRKWDRDEIDAPAIKKQRPPVFPAATITALIERSSGPERMLYALLAGAGMRVGEALGLNVSNIAADYRRAWMRATRLPRLS